MRMFLLAPVASGMLVGAGVAGAASGSTPHFATSLGACFSPDSPILDAHYGSDDRRCSQKMIENRAASEDESSQKAQETQPRYATQRPSCFSKLSPLLDDHYGYDDRDCR